MERIEVLRSEKSSQTVLYSNSMYSKGSSYYKQVGDYYNEDAGNFESRGRANETLNRIRAGFREQADKVPFQRALEVGIGPGMDMLYFTGRNPDALVYGIDISAEMCRLSKENLAAAGATNGHVSVGSVEDISELFPGVQFDLIYVFFGALNTVESLPKAAAEMESLLAPNGKMVLTFVNKWYLLGILRPLVKLKFGTAFRRLRKVWGGYSPSRFLASKCYSPAEVRKAFSGSKELYHRGYSILFPAWYEEAKRQKMGAKAERLWARDERLSKTPFWSLGEYTLFVFEKKR